MIQRIHIDRCPVDCLSKDRALALFQQAISENRRMFVYPVNAWTVVEARRNAPLREALEALDVGLPDGFWIQAAARAAGLPSPAHVPTVPLVRAFLEDFARGGGRVFLLGGSGEVVESAAANLSLRYPGLVIAGMRDGYFNESDEPEILRQIGAADPGLVLIGITSPKRELFMQRRRAEFPSAVIAGVGGMFDILAGKTPEGPGWLRKFGMMWLYRLACEPRRLWRRYTTVNLAFMWIALKQALKCRLGLAARTRTQEDARGEPCDPSTGMKLNPQSEIRNPQFK